ncbi:DUF2321 domain-containing protein [Muricoccus pecuniae]|uniref:DUF2321 domain-containing protein n=1 Tax=Muricoccus pecuniae TaxID=693023 RepID=A0A840YGS7_9PROT|nr:DUF2321 domain-containing protein [Roseomonas pecuniae]MBB5695511.1 hypothetical protein [Roseomonas pecuniae]
MSGYFDLMQVCTNGHVITDNAASLPHFRRPFCSICGESTITACPVCQASIPGEYHVPGVLVLSGATSTAPNNCANCGVAFPWRQASLASAVEILEMDLEGQDAVDAAALVPLIATENPKTELAALKLKRLMSKMTKPAYDVAIKVVSDLASETAKKMLGMKP